jgi:hypothetical protein
MTVRKFGVIIISFVLAYIVAEGLFPTPNIVDGGAAKMFILIFLAVGFKATIEFLLGKWKKKKD